MKHLYVIVRIAPFMTLIATYYALLFHYDNNKPRTINASKITHVHTAIPLSIPNYPNALCSIHAC